VKGSVAGAPSRADVDALAGIQKAPSSSEQESINEEE